MTQKPLIYLMMLAVWLLAETFGMYRRMSHGANSRRPALN